MNRLEDRNLTDHLGETESENRIEGLLTWSRDMVRRIRPFKIPL